jgi:hemerythrin
MLNFDWTEAQAVYVPQVDDEHKALFKLCGDLHRALRDGRSATVSQSILRHLVTHAEEHFTHEEREMRTTGYSHYAWHRRQHRAARVRLRALEQRVQDNETETALELVGFLGGWLNDHIRLADRMLGAYLRNQQRARAAQAS